MTYRETRADLPQSPLEHGARVLLRIAKFVLLLLIVPAILLCFKNPLHEQTAVRETIAQLQQQRDGLKAERDMLLREKTWIEQDDAYLELKARDRLNRQKEGEHILRFE